MGRNLMAELNADRECGVKPIFSEVARRYGVDRHTVSKYWNGSVPSSALDRALEAESYDRQKTLHRMDDEGVLVMGSGRRFTMQRRFKGGTRRYCVCIDNTRLEEPLDRGSGDATGVALASSTESPR